jgi:hypothetical protein
MNTSLHQLGRQGGSRVFSDPRMRVGALAVVALLVEAAIAAFVLDMHLNFFAQLAPFWVFVAYKLSGRRDRTSETIASVAVVVVTVGVLVASAL